MQVATISGYVGQEPKKVSLQNGNALTEVSVGVRAKKDTTVWWKVAFFGKTAEQAADYIKKGDIISVSGRLELEEWTDRDGVKQMTPKISATPDWSRYNSEKKKKDDSDGW